MTMKTITAFVDYPSDWNERGTVTPLGKIMEAANLLNSQSMSTVIDKKVAFRVRNQTKSSSTIRKNTQLAEFSVVSPEQSKFIKPVNTANPP